MMMPETCHAARGSVWGLFRRVMADSFILVVKKQNKREKFPEKS